MPQSPPQSFALRHFWTKFFGHCLAISTFFAAYFLVAQYPLFVVFEMPHVAVDAWAPLWPWTAWIYFSLWVYICLPAALMDSRLLLWRFFLGAFWMGFIGIAIFVFWPTSTPQFVDDWSGYPATLSFMKSEELSRNACPSLHVSFAVFTALWLRWLMRRTNCGRLWLLSNALWAVAIILSTMTTKQHVFLDVVFGGLFGLLIFAVNIVWVQRDERLA